MTFGTKMRNPVINTKQPIVDWNEWATWGLVCARWFDRPYNGYWIFPWCEERRVLLFIDNTFRFIQGCLEVIRSLGRASAVRWVINSILAKWRRCLYERITSTKEGPLRLYKPVMHLPMTWLTPTSRHLLTLDATTVLSRSSRNLHYPAVDPLDSVLPYLGPSCPWDEHYNVVHQEVLQISRLTRYHQI